MPVYRGKDSHGYFYQWGKNIPGRKKWTRYYYMANNERSRTYAKRKAIKQGLAVMINRQR